MLEKASINLAIFAIMFFINILHAEVTIWPVSPAQRAFQDIKPSTDASTSLEISGILNEYESAQLALLNNSDINLIIITDTLKNDEGAVFPSDIRIRTVQAIDVTKSSPAAAKDYLSRIPPFPYPDALLETNKISLKANKTASVYFTIFIPKTVKPGIYKGKINILKENGDNITQFPINIEVLPVTLSDINSSHLKITYWYELKPFFEYHHVKPWSPEFWAIYENYVKNMVAHRQNMFRVGPMQDYFENVELSVDKNGKLQCNFSRLDKMIEIILCNGGKYLEFWGPAKFNSWTDTDVYFPEMKAADANGNAQMLSFEKGTKPYLQQLYKHIIEKGWIDISYIHVSDEPIGKNLQTWKNVAMTMHQYMPKMRLIDAVCTIGMDKELDVIVPKINDFLAYYNDYYKPLMNNGKEVWFYTCCQPWAGEIINQFLDQPLELTTYKHWMNWYTKTDGFLHWGLNHWKGEKFTENRRSPGDYYIIYPGDKGPLDSLRWEQSRESAEEYEKLWLLTEKMQTAKKMLGKSAKDFDPNEAANAICCRVIKNPAKYASVSEYTAARMDLNKQLTNALESPLVMLKTSPHIGSRLYYGPYSFIVEGVTEPGAKVKIADEEIRVDENGYFIHQLRSSYKTNIEINMNGKTKTFYRIFDVDIEKENWWWYPETND